MTTPKEDTKLIKWVLIIAGIILSCMATATFFYLTFPPYASPPSSSLSNEAPGTPSSFPPPNVSGAIPTVFELQTALCDAGYTVKIDGVIGEETIAAWDSYCADRFAAKFMTLDGSPK